MMKGDATTDHSRPPSSFAGPLPARTANDPPRTGRGELTTPSRSLVELKRGEILVRVVRVLNGDAAVAK